MAAKGHLVEYVTDESIFELVDRRRDFVAQFVRWVTACLDGGHPLRLRDRMDLAESELVSSEFTERWWGVTVYTCFGTVQGTRRARSVFGVEPPVTRLDELSLSLRAAMIPGDIGSHRTQPGHKGAVIALRAACEHSDEFESILLRQDGTFDDRYQDLLRLELPQWKRTTCFDLMLRAGWLGLAGRRIEPEIAYLRGSQGPQAGLKKVLGIILASDNAALCEGTLQAWSRNWAAVARSVGIEWHGDAFSPGDFENALCIYQEPLHRGWPDPADFATGAR